MKVKIEFELPNWSRWVAAGVLLGFVFGYGVASVRATTVTLPKTWQKGEVLTAEALNRNFADLQNAINTQQMAIQALSSAVCPVEYVRDNEAVDIIVCKRGADEVIRVGSGGSAFWIDRYEASVWDSPDATSRQFGLLGPDSFPVGFPRNGQYTTPVYAVSKSNVTPSAYISWFQAIAACEASGKRLPTREEWLLAANGTPDPGDRKDAYGSCLTGGPPLRATGLGTACRSRWGVEDMIGNVWEWTAEWHLSVFPPFATDTSVDASQDAKDLSGDGFWGVGAFDPVAQKGYLGLPQPVARGGSDYDRAKAGIFAMTINYGMLGQADILGFRCVVSR